MLSRSNWLILGLAVLAAAAGGYVDHRNQPPTPMDSTLVGQSLPALALRDLGGKLHPLSDYRGHRVLLNFWASWCRPCLEEMPTLTRAREKFGDRAPIVIGIAMDEPANARTFLATHPVNYPILLGQLTPPSTSLQLGNAREMLPYSVLVGADGRILATQTGILSASQLQKWFAPVHASP